MAEPLPIRLDEPKTQADIEYDAELREAWAMYYRSGSKERLQQLGIL